jgi:hypothetical protein
MDNANFVFEVLLRDTVLMNKLDEAIRLFKEENLLRYKHVPQLVKALMEVLCSQVLNSGWLKKDWRGKYKVKEFNLTRADTYLLLDLYRTYILEKLTCEDAYVNEFTSVYNTCISLVVMQLPFTKK